MPDYESPSQTTETPRTEHEETPQVDQTGQSEVGGNAAMNENVGDGVGSPVVPVLTAAGLDDASDNGLPDWAMPAVDGALANEGRIPDPIMTPDGPMQLPPASLALATVASAGDPIEVATYLQRAIFQGSDEDILAMAASMPDLIASLPPEQQVIVGQAMQNLGDQWDGLGRDANPDAYSRMQMVGTEWYHQQGILGRDQYGVDTEESVSVNWEHWEEGTDLDGAHTDMNVPNIFWTHEGNLGRYLDTQGVVYVGEDGLRIFRSDGSMNVTTEEIEVMGDVGFMGPGSVQLADGSSAAMLRDSATGEVKYVIRGADGVQVVTEDQLPAAVTQQAEAVVNSTRVEGNEVEVDQINGEADGNLVGAAFTDGLLGPGNSRFSIDQTSAQDGGNVYGLVASGDTLDGGTFEITQNVMGTDDAQYHLGEDGTLEVAGHWGAVLDGDVTNTTLSVGGETPGPILVNGNIGPGTTITGSTVIVHGDIDPSAVVEADTVLRVGEDGTTERYDPETREFVPYDGETMRQDDPIAFQETLSLRDGNIDVNTPTTTSSSGLEFENGVASGNYTQTTTDGHGNTDATSWSLGVGNGQLSGSLERKITQNGNQATGGANVAIDPRTGAVTVEGNGGYRWGENGPSVNGTASFTWQDGQMQGWDASLGGAYGEGSITVSAGMDDYDYAAFEGGGPSPGDERITYGQVHGWEVGGSAEIPAGPVQIGVNGEIERSHTTSAFTRAENLPGVDPSLAYTDPAAFREQVADAMADRVAGIESVDDVGVDTFDTWQVGDGLVLENSGTDTLGASLGVGKSLASVSVGLEHSEGREEQTTMELVNDDPRTLEVTVANVDTETWNASLDGGPLSLSSANTNGTGSSVSFQFDLDSPQGQAAYEAYRTTSILPGALDYAQSAGLIPANIDISDPAQLRQVAGQVNNAFMQSPAFALGLTEDGTNYTGSALDRTHQQTDALSVLGFELLSHELVEVWRDRRYLEEGNEETERSYNRSESGWFSSDTETTGIVMNPEFGTLPDGSTVEMMMFAQEHRGHIDPSDLGPYLDHVPRDQVDPLTRAWLDGEIDDGSFDAVVSMGMTLTDDHLAALDLALDDGSQADQDRAASIDGAITAELDDTMQWAGMERVVADDGTTSWQITDPNMFAQWQQRAWNSGNYDYDESDFQRDMFGMALQSMGVDTAALDADAAQASNFGHVPFEETQGAMYENAINALYDADGTDEGFANLALFDPSLQNAYLTTAAERLDNPWDAMDLAIDLQGDRRDEAMRQLFATIEGRDGGNNAMESFYEWTDGLNPAVRDAVRSGLTVRVLDRSVMDTMADITDQKHDVPEDDMRYFLQDYQQNPNDPINYFNNDQQNQVAVELTAATELAQAGNPAYLQELLGTIATMETGPDGQQDGVGMMFAALRDPAMQGIYLDALAMMDAGSANGSAPTQYMDQALAYIAANPTSLVNALSSGNPETQAALLERLGQQGADVDQILLGGAQEAMTRFVDMTAEGYDPMSTMRDRDGVLAVIGQFSDDPEMMQQTMDALLAVPGLAEASDEIGGGGDPVGAMMAVLSRDAPGAALDIAEAMLGTTWGPDVEAALRANPGMVFDETFHSDGAQALYVLDQLDAMGLDGMGLLGDALTQDGHVDQDILNRNIDWSDPTAVGELLADREQEHNWHGGWDPHTNEMTAILLQANAQGPEFLTNVVNAYEASGQRPGDDTITNMLDAMNKGDSTQVALAAAALRTAGYGEEVAAWMADHGGDMNLDDVDW
ncbi:MAG: hypothetical protein H6738_01385 [Alphaproteobacteria bacterium]|nr:hypothetical protein [Alphaproteobacteria bacterium]MCB9695420.1 hypothetical protein [Alphaproteobacteria bacterium]